MNNDDLAPLIEDYFVSGAATQDREATMDKNNWEQIAQVAEFAFKDAEPQTMQEATWCQNMLLVEMALQQVETNALLARIATALEMLEGR